MSRQADAVWKLSIQFVFKEVAEGEDNSVGNLLINHRRRWAAANLVLPLTGYPQFVQDLLKLESLGEQDLKKLLAFFTGLNNTTVPQKTV